MAKYTLTSYDPIEITVPKMSVPEDYIAAQIEEKLEAAAKYIPLEEPRPVRMYDFLTVTTSDAAIDGNPAAFMNHDHIFHVVGSGEMPREFDAAIIGAQIGETREARFGVKATLGAEGGRSMMTMNVLVEQIYNREMPPLTDELVAEHLAPISTVEELRESICEEFLTQNLNKDSSMMANEVLREVARRLVEEPDPADAMPEMGPFELRATCGIDAFTDYFGIELTAEEATQYLPGETPIQKLQMRAELESNGQSEEFYQFARREATLARLIEEAKISFA